MLKGLLKKIWKPVSRAVFSDLNLRRLRDSKPYLELVQREGNAVNRLRSEFAPLVRRTDKRSRLQLHERKVFSQNGEDGLLLHIFDRIGAPHKNFIEFGIEDGTECNSANLAIHFGWHGLFLEGSPSLAERARAFYHQRHGLRPQDVQVVCAFITKENVNELFASHGFKGEIDLLSVDIDGNDYWVWQAIDVINPRVVAVEYNASFGSERAITVKYDPAFDRYQKHPSGWYHGASLGALAKLAHSKNYLLAGCDSFGANAFFVRRDVAEGKLEELSVTEAFYPCPPRLREASQAEQFARVSQLEFVEV
jgi:hypothetical protein